MQRKYQQRQKVYERKLEKMKKKREKKEKKRKEREAKKRLLLRWRERMAMKAAEEAAAEEGVGGGEEIDIKA